LIHLDPRRPACFVQLNSNIVCDMIADDASGGQQAEPPLAPYVEQHDGGVG
jgi:hypothetical protein